MYKLCLATVIVVLAVLAGNGYAIPLQNIEVRDGNCTSCTAGQVTFTPMTTPDTEDAVNGGIGVDANGCSTLTAICPANPNAGFFVFMQFNSVQGGPISVQGAQVQVVLKCVNGQWTFTQGGIARVITEVNCIIGTPS